jgi:hypothetical protein
MKANNIGSIFQALLEEHAHFHIHMPVIHEHPQTEHAYSHMPDIHQRQEE